MLNSISHELRTPIAAITAAASALTELRGQEQTTMRRNLAVGKFRKAPLRLNRLVSNLLDMHPPGIMGAVKPRLEWCDVADLVNVALRHNEKELIRSSPSGTLSLPPQLPLVRMDFVLIEQVINNLFTERRSKAYTPKGTPVELKAWAAPDVMAISVADRGPGLPFPDSLGCACF